jgi:hypothetical protein
VPVVGTSLVARCWTALASPKLAAPATAAGTATKNSVDVDCDTTHSRAVVGAPWASRGFDAKSSKA